MSFRKNVIKIVFFFQPWFKKLMKIEVEVTKNGLVRQSVNRHRIFRQRSGLASLLGGGGIEDDHKPFERRGNDSPSIILENILNIFICRRAYFTYNLIAFSGRVAYHQ